MACRCWHTPPCCEPTVLLTLCRNLEGSSAPFPSLTARLQQPFGAQPRTFSSGELLRQPLPLGGLLSPGCHCRLATALSSRPPLLWKDLLTGLFSLLDKIPEQGGQESPHVGIPPCSRAQGAGRRARCLRAGVICRKNSSGTCLGSEGWQWDCDEVTPTSSPGAPQQWPQDGNSFQTT